MAYKNKTKLAHRSNYGNKRSTSSIKYIVIHYTANDGDTDENNAKYFQQPNRNASAHRFVDDDSVTKSVPDNYVAWSVGGNKYPSCNETGGGKYYNICTNNNSLSIELCDDVKNGKVYPSAKTIENAINLTKKLMKKYKIPQKNVIRHFDVTGKKCPAYWVDNAKWKKEFWSKLETKKKAEVKTEYFPKHKDSTKSIVAAFKNLGINSSFSYRSKIAKANNIKNYIGTAKQNTTMLNLLKNGKLIKP